AASGGAVVLAALDDHPPIRQHRRAKIERGIAAGERRYLGPSAVHVTAAAVRRQLVPRAEIRIGAAQAVRLRHHHHRAVSQQQHGAGVKTRLMRQRLPALRGSQTCSECRCDDHRSQRNSYTSQCLHCFSPQAGAAETPHHRMLAGDFAVVSRYEQRVLRLKAVLLLTYARISDSEFPLKVALGRMWRGRPRPRAGYWLLTTDY